MFLQVKYGKVFFFSVNELQKNSNASSKEEHIPQILTIFFVDSSHLHLGFASIRLLSVGPKQWLKQYNYYVTQSDLLNRFWTDFTSSVCNFCR